MWGSLHVVMHQILCIASDESVQFGGLEIMFIAWMLQIHVCMYIYIYLRRNTIISLRMPHCHTHIYVSF